MNVKEVQKYYQGIDMDTPADKYSPEVWEMIEAILELCDYCNDLEIELRQAKMGKTVIKDSSGRVIGAQG